MNNILHRDPVREPAVHVMKNGPYLVVGGPALSSNLQPLSPEHFALCRCGASKNKPFCDGSHYDIGFRHEVR